ncbi:MAG: SIS domain-containing protein [Nostoc sp. ChiSLP01]|nr:D-sedoheptulose 7-phosphate isomerase [Nostoc sp. CmiSLP01]MDZ8288004.1 D-sedoheptulose 7-phosphate isomerase [Nostoc sp. ChiSLP01]
MDSIIRQHVIQELKESCEVKQKLLQETKIVSVIQEVAEKFVEVYGRGNKTLISGNGGSASDAQHMAAELSGRFNFDRPGIPSIALSANTAALTAIGNDYGYEKVFSRQVQAYGNEGDLFFGISTSGNSLNILEAVYECKNKGMTSIGLTGLSGHKLAAVCDYCIMVPSLSTPRIQECHILIIHTICSIIEESLFGHKFSQFRHTQSLLNK